MTYIKNDQNRSWDLSLGPLCANLTKRIPQGSVLNYQSKLAVRFGDQSAENSLATDEEKEIFICSKTYNATHDRKNKLSDTIAKWAKTIDL